MRFRLGHGFLLYSIYCLKLLLCQIFFLLSADILLITSLSELVSPEPCPAVVLESVFMIVPEDNAMVFQILVNIELNASNPFVSQSQSKTYTIPPKKKEAIQPFMAPAGAVYE